MKKLYLAFLVCCGGDVIPSGPDIDASGNPTLHDAGSVLDGSAPGISRNGWTWTNVGPQGADLYGAWGSSPNDVWFVGAAGMILHWDGHSFAPFDSGTDEELHDVWGTGSSDVWVVGHAYSTTAPSVVLHWNGTAWSQTAFDDGGDNLESVSGSATSNVWIVGDKGFAAHWDAAAWTRTDTGTMNDLDSVWTSGPSDAWAVGSATPFATAGTIVHWNGTTWSPVALPDMGRGRFARVWGTSSSDLWLAGQAQIDLGQPAEDPSGYVIHWNGSTWDARFVVPTFATPLFGGDATTTVGTGVALTWHGAWNEQPLSGDYRATWQSSPSDVWAVGMGGVMAHFDGSAWTQISPPPPPRGIYVAAALWANTATDAWIAGNSPISAELQHWDGTAWRPSTIPSTSPAYVYFTNLWGTAANDMWGVGTGPDPRSGRIVHWDGTSWTDMYDDPSNDGFWSAWGASASDVWFGGDNGTLVHWNGTAMTSMPIMTTDGFQAMRGSSSTDIWMAGNTNDAVTMRHWNGTAWSEVATPPSGFVSSLYVASPSDVWAAGWEGGSLHWDGSTWTATMMPVEVGALWGSSASDIWAVGWFGAVLHYDGTSWTLVPVTEADVIGVSGSGPSDVWMVTSAGAILHHP